MYLKRIVIVMKARRKWKDSKLHILFIKLSCDSYLTNSNLADLSNRLHTLTFSSSNIARCAVVRVRLQTGVAYSILGCTYDL